MLKRGYEGNNVFGFFKANLFSGLRWWSNIPACRGVTVSEEYVWKYAFSARQGHGRAACVGFDLYICRIMMQHTFGPAPEMWGGFKLAYNTIWTMATFNFPQFLFLTALHLKEYHVFEWYLNGFGLCSYTWTFNYLESTDGRKRCVLTVGFCTGETTICFKITQYSAPSFSLKGIHICMYEQNGEISPWISVHQG